MPDTLAIDNNRRRNILSVVTLITARANILRRLGVASVEADDVFNRCLGPERRMRLAGVTSIRETPKEIAAAFKTTVE